LSRLRPSPPNSQTRSKVVGKIRLKPTVGPGNYLHHIAVAAGFRGLFERTLTLKCRRCAVKSQVGNLFFSGILGWWGFPWGLIFTPVQVGRNFMAIFTPPDPSQPSDKLVQAARIQLASQGK